MKKPFLIALLVFFSLPLLAQQRWGGGVDYEKINFGFSFHYVASSFKVFKTSDWREAYSDPSVRGPLSEISSPFNTGIGLGLLADLKFAKNANLRFNPAIVFAGKTLDYSYPNLINAISGEDEILYKTVRASLLELPLTVKFRSDPRKNYTIYVLGGGKYSRNVMPKSRLNDSDQSDIDKFVKLKPNFLSYEFGLGVELYFEYFKMSPEIKWSQSIGNVLDHREINAFNSPIDKLLLRSVQFSLIFE